jgi:AcrR family transcriptional regulator
MEKPSKASPRGELTRDALLDAAMLAFARLGFRSANLREIAQAAGVNQALIGYHFRSKEGLYLAVFERMIRQMRQGFDPLLARIGQMLEAPGPPGVQRYLTPLLTLLEAMLVHMVHEHPAWAELIVREQLSPTAAYDLLYDGIISPGHGALIGLLRQIRKNDEPERVCLLAATLASQVLIVRSSRASLLRLLDWDSIGDRELETMKALLRRNATLLALGD